MKSVSFSSPLKNYWGKPLSELKQKEGATPVVGPLKYSGSFDAYETFAEIAAAKDEPSNEEVVKFRNAQRKANAKNKAAAAAISAAGFIQPTIDNDDQLRLTRMFELFLSNIPASVREADPEAAKRQAREEAATALKLEWADEDED